MSAHEDRPSSPLHIDEHELDHTADGAADEPAVETQPADNDDDDDDDTQIPESEPAVEAAAAEPEADKPQPPKAPRKRNPQPTSITREPGKSVFPVSRVQKILKADKDLPMVSREAVFLISLATEEFIARLSLSSALYARKEGRTTVQRKDTALAVRRGDEFWFLEEIIPWSDPEATERRKPKALQKLEGATMLDAFVQRSRKPDEDGGGDGGVDEAGDVMMNEDGTMSFAPAEAVPVAEDSQ